MTAPRIKGQEVTVGWTSPEGDVEGLADVLSFTSTSAMEILEEEYLGQTAKSYDDIYHGEEGEAELHLSSAAWIVLQERIIDRAQRRTPAGGSFTATATYQLPDGTRVRITYEDLFWGAMPLSSDTRTAYVKLSLSWKCAQARRIL